MLLSIGKTQEAWIRSGMEVYLKRLPHYLPFEYHELPDVKNARKLGNDLLKEAEGKAFLAKLDNTDHVILLDEGGKVRTS